MNFEELQKAIADQATLAKSLSAAQVDAKGNAVVSADAAAGNASTDEEEEDEGNGNGDLGDGSPMIKSFKLVLEDGTEMEAQDATEMVKCLLAEINLVKGAQASHGEQMMKSLGGTVELITTLTEGLKATRSDVLAISKKNDELVAANAELTKSLNAMGGTGRGKRSVDVVLGARPELNGKVAAEASAHTPKEIMAKAQSALSKGQISAVEATKIETALNMSIMPEKAILDHLFSA